jgi:hypothetical protein
MRFYNPVKELCQKANLDYETVIGYGVSPSMRQVFLNADIPKPLNEYTSKDRQAVKNKTEFLNRKYGSTDEPVSEGGDVKDKGLERYTKELIVEPVLPDRREGDESSSSSNVVESNNKGPVGERRAVVWVPGKGVKYRT